MDWIALLGLERRLNEARQLAAEVAAEAEDRAELLAIEWREEKARWQRLLALLVLAGALSIVVCTVLSLAVMVQFWDGPWRVPAAWGVAGFWLLLWVGVLWGLWHVHRRGRAAFALSRQEWARDWATWKERL